MQHKKCNVCRKHKDVACFELQRGTCKVCRGKYVKKYTIANKEKNSKAKKSL